jgi:predicted O-linked N-acetylglucosamine transferase (SPINDLY family)
LTDPYSTPSESHHDFCEKIWYLPETRLCMTQPLVPTDFPVNPLPALETGFITFGCFQTLAKINDDVLSAWSSILARVPNSRLRIQSRHLAMPDIQTDLSRRLAKAGIDLSRVALHGGGPTPMYFKAHNQIDMILDTFPYPGGTTTAEALWMGVPTLTINGNSLLARQGASMLHNAGLSDWIANDESDYVAKAVNFASDTTALATMRARLRQQVLGSPLFDGGRFAKHLTTALFAMFKDRAQRLQKHSGQTD